MSLDKATLDNVKTVPPNMETQFKVTNLYVELVDGSPKLRVEYEKVID